jgi:hypothetical protein
MHDEKGVVAEVTKSFCQKAEIAVPEKLVRADSEVGVEKDFQELKLRRERYAIGFFFCRAKNPEHHKINK